MRCVDCKSTYSGCGYWMGCVYTRARRQNAKGTPMLEEILVLLEYRPEDDSWDTDGRRTYSNDVNATQARVNRLGRALNSIGWEPMKNRKGICRMFRDPKSCEIIEIEPGGDDCTGHYLHLMKAETANEH